MNWVQLILSISLLLSTIESKDIETNDINSNSNFDSDQLRKALLKALTELENEDPSKNDENNEDTEINSKTIFYSTTARSEESDRIVEKASASAISFFTNEKVDASTEKLNEENSDVQIFTKDDSNNGDLTSTVRIFGRNGGFSATTEHILDGGFTPEGFKKNVKYSEVNKHSVTENEDGKVVINKKVTSSSQKFVKTTNSDEESKSSSTQKPLVIIQKSSGVQQRPIISVLNEDNEEGFLASASGGNQFADKNNYANKNSENYISKTISNKNTFSSGIKTVSITPKPDSSTTTTFTPSTSTEESEAKAEDVQFFSAPLVAAFTVHQDERGLPKKVEPIYKPTATVAPNQQKQELKQQLDLHEKQKLLEQEIFKLQQQRTQHELLLRQIQQQNIINQGQQNLINEKHQQQQNFVASNQFQSNFGSQTERPFIPIVNPIQTTLQSLTGNQFFATTPIPNLNNQFLNQQHFANQVSITKSQQQIFPANQQNFHSSSFNGNQITNSHISSNDALQNSNLASQISITNPPPLNQIPTNNLLHQNQFSSNNFVDNKNNFNQNLKTNQFSNLNQVVPSVQLNQNNFAQNFNGKNQFQSFENKQKNNNFLNQNGFSPLKKFNTLVSLQPSLAVNPTSPAFPSSALPLNAQIPPIKNAVEFRPNVNQFSSSSLILPQENNFGKPLLENNNLGKILSPPPQQQDLSFGKFQSPNNFVQNLPHVQSTRVFRQEQHTGNLGLNNQFNLQNQFNSANSQNFALNNNNHQFNQNFGFNSNNQFNNNFHPTRIFRSNQESFHNTRNQHQHQQNINQHLNNLLYNSGITRNVRQNDDLNIVSKILSYNVGRDNYFSGSRNSEQRLVPKVK